MSTVAGGPRTSGWFGDLVDTVTSDPFFVILGSVLTAGSYGYASGLLNVTGVQRVALEESMKAFAGMAATAAQNFAACKLSGREGCKVEAPGFFEAWQGQVAYRTKSMILAGGPAQAAALSQAFANQLAVWVKPEYLDSLRNGWETYKKTEAYAKDAEREARAYLDAKTKECAEVLGTPCRKDVVAIATNAAVGSTVFDTTDWDPITGEPPPPVTTNLTTGEAMKRWQDALKSQGNADNPVVQQALAVYHAAKKRDEQINEARIARADRLAKAAEAQTYLSRACREGDASACAATQAVPTGSAGGARATEPPSLLAQGLLLSALTAPFWVPAVLWPLWKRRKSSGKRSR